MAAAYWLTFEKPIPRPNLKGNQSPNVRAACAYAESEAAARELAEKHGAVVVKIETLPYPAHPRLDALEGECPSFCYSPESCKGHGSCRKSYSCVD